jgi:hypothetical protein
VTVCFNASFTSRTLATMRKFVANRIAPGLSRLNPLAWIAACLRKRARGT